MYELIRAAAIEQLAGHVGLPDALLAEVSLVAQQQPERFARFLEGKYLAIADPKIAAAFKQFRQLLPQLEKGFQFPEDAATLVSNFQEITGRPFIKPGWLSEKMRAAE